MSFGVGSDIELSGFQLSGGRAFGIEVESIDSNHCVKENGWKVNEVGGVAVSRRLFQTLRDLYEEIGTLWWVSSGHAGDMPKRTGQWQPSTVAFLRKRVHKKPTSGVSKHVPRSFNPYSMGIAKALC